MAGGSTISRNYTAHCSAFISCSQCWLSYPKLTAAVMITFVLSTGTFSGEIEVTPCRQQQRGLAEWMVGSGVQPVSVVRTNIDYLPIGRATDRVCVSFLAVCLSPVNWRRLPCPLWGTRRGQKTEMATPGLLFPHPPLPTATHAVSYSNTHRFPQQHTQFPTATHTASHSNTRSFLQQHTPLPTATHAVSYSNTHRFPQQHTQFPTATHTASHSNTPVSYSNTHRFPQQHTQFPTATHTASHSNTRSSSK